MIQDKLPPPFIVKSADWMPKGSVIPIPNRRDEVFSWLVGEGARQVYKQELRPSRNIRPGRTRSDQRQPPTAGDPGTAGTSSDRQRLDIDPSRLGVAVIGAFGKLHRLRAFQQCWDERLPVGNMAQKSLQHNGKLGG